MAEVIDTNIENLKILYDKDQISEKVKALANQIKKDFPDKVHGVIVLTGAMVFFVDLMRELKKLDVETIIMPMKVSSYSGTKSTGRINVELDIKEDIKGKDILIVEDIIDTGLTLKHLKEYIKKKGARSARICALLDKKSARKEKIDADYVGFTIPDKFVVGYGIDYDESFRDLDYIGFFE